MATQLDARRAEGDIALHDEPRRHRKVQVADVLTQRRRDAYPPLEGSRPMGKRTRRAKRVPRVRRGESRVEREERVEKRRVKSIFIYGDKRRVHSFKRFENSAGERESYGFSPY